MGRPPKVRDEELPADVKWDESEEQWIASAVGPDGTRIKTPPQNTTTQAISRLELLLREHYQRPLPVKAKIHVPAALKKRLDTYAKKLPVFEELANYIKTERRDLAVEMTEKYQIPVRTAAQILGWSPQRLGTILNEWVVSQSEATSGKRRNRVVEDEGE